MRIRTPELSDFSAGTDGWNVVGGAVSPCQGVGRPLLRSRGSSDTGNAAMLVKTFTGLAPHNAVQVEMMIAPFHTSGTMTVVFAIDNRLVVRRTFVANPQQLCQVTSTMM